MANTLKNMLLVLAIIVPCMALRAQDMDRKVLENAYLQAVQQYEGGDYKKAAATLKAILNKDDSMDAAHYYLGLCAAGMNDMEEAELHITKAVQLDSTNYWYRQRAAVLYTATGREEQAIKEYEAILRDFPKKSDVYYNLIELYSSTGRNEDALDILDKIEGLQGRSDGTVMARFQLMGQMNHQQEAYDFLESVYDEYPSPQILSVLGDYNLSMYKDSLAVALYDEALSMAPGYAPAVVGKAEVHRMKRDYAKFIEALEPFVADPSSPVDMKMDYLKQIVQHADQRLIQGHRDDLYRLYQLCADTHPESSMASSYLVSLKLAYDDYEGVAESAEKAMKDFPDDDSFLEIATYAEYQLGNLEKVLDLSHVQLERAMKSGDKKQIATASTNVGDGYHSLGDNRKAYKYYEAALKNDPDYAPALNNYAYYLSTTGKKLKKAYQMSRRCTELEPDNATYLDTFGWILHLMGKDTEALAIFKRVMIYGGKDNAEELRHYADVLEATGKKDLAEMYRSQAAAKEKK